MVPRIASIMALAMLAGGLHAQCAPGIPGAGNPGCIPPNAPNSPYNQGSGANTPPPQPVGHWEDRWAAVALDYQNLKSGMVSSKADEASASSGALAECRANGGASCELAIAYHNQCAALAQHTTTHEVSSATGPDVSQAVNRVKTRCGDSGACQVIYSQCSLPILVK